MSSPNDTKIALSGLQEPSSDEFLAHPDFRQIAAFFLGWVFMSSISCILYSSIIQNLLQRFLSRLSTLTGPFPSDPEAASEKSSSTWTTSFQGSRFYSKGDNHTLVFTLCICFAFASIAHFSSLLTFNPNKGATACAFLVAWGGMAAQSARLVGLLILSFELRQLGLGRWESIIFWLWLGVGIVFVFVTNAISIGTIKVVDKLEISLCYRKHFIATSLVSSLIYLFLDLYVIVRLAWLIAPPFFQMRQRLGVITDRRLVKALSLMLLEILTIVPTAIFTGVVGEFVPFSLGALAVLAAFNHRSPHSVKLKMNSIPPSREGSLPSRRSVAPRPHSLVLPIADSSKAPPYSPYKPQPIPNHPFAAETLDDSPPPEENWQHQLNTDQSSRYIDRSSHYTARSSRTIDSATAKSIRSAVVQVAARGARTPMNAIIPPLPVNNRNNTRLMTERIGLGEDSALSQISAQRQILPNQTRYAEQFNRELPKRSHPAVTIDTDSPQLQSWPTSAPMTPRAPRSPNSAVYGSDVIRLGRNSSTETRRQSSNSGGAVNASHTTYSRSPRETLMSSSDRSTTRRYSWASVVPAPTEELPTFAFEGRPETYSRSRVPTFGEQAFKDQLSLVSPPRASTSAQSLSRPRVSIRGPRPPPPSPFQADRQFLSLPSATDDRRRRRRSGSLPTANLPFYDESGRF